MDIGHLPTVTITRRSLTRRRGLLSHSRRAIDHRAQLPNGQMSRNPSTQPMFPVQFLKYHQLLWNCNHCFVFRAKERHGMSKCYSTSGHWKYERGLSRLMHDDLHWLVIPQRVQYKLAVTVHRCLRLRAPTYLADYCVPVSEVAGRCDLPDVINCQFRQFSAAPLRPVHFLSPDQESGIHWLIVCGIQLLSPNTWGETWTRNLSVRWTFIVLSRPSFQLPIFSNHQYTWDWVVTNWKLGQDETKLSCLVCSCVHTDKRQDKTVLSYLCRRCEQATTLQDCKWSVSKFRRVV